MKLTSSPVDAADCEAQIIASNAFTSRVTAIVAEWMDNPVDTAEDLREQLEAVKAKQPVAIQVLREVLR